MSALMFRRFAGILSITTLLAAVLLSFPSAAADNELTLETKIASATIYWGLAHITRSGRVEVKPGMYRVICDDLPKGFNESSLQVSGLGTANATVLGVDIVQRRGEVTETPRYKELKDRLDLLTAQKDSLGITLASLQERKAFISNLGSYPFRERNDEEKLDIFRVTDWKTLIDFLEKERTLAERTTYHINKKVQEIRKEIDWITAELNSMRSKGTWNKRVAIECEVFSDGLLDLDLTYIVPGASWEPEYTARYQTSDGTLELVYNAKLSQVTGEDWKNTSVMLSTAQPQVGAAPPKLTPYYIMMYDEVARKLERKMKAQEFAVAAEMAAPAEAERFADTDALGGAGVRIPTAAADAAASEFATNLSIRKRVDLSSGSDPRRFMILSKGLTGEFTRYTAPRMSQKVFVQGTFTNTLDVPILAGTAEVYIETPGPGGKGTVSNFVGKEGLTSVIAGEEFDLHLGVDQDMKVEHKRVKKERLTKQGAKTTKIRYSYLIMLESFKKDSVTVTLQDRIPVSHVKEVKVTSVDLEPKPDEEQGDGILTWKFEMSAGGKQEVRIEYTIEYPGDWPTRRLNIE